MPNVTILVQSCDKNSDLWPVFFSVLKKQWPNCHERIVLNTETKDFTFPGLDIETFKLYENYDDESLQKVSWSERFIETLNKITTKYVFVILDDFFIRETVDDKNFEALVEKVDNIKNFGAVYFNFLNQPTFYNKKLDMYYIHHDTWTRVNSVSGLWLTSELKNTLVVGETPWTYEQNATQRYKGKKNIKFYSIDKSVAPISIDFHEQLVQGKWSFECVELLKKLGMAEYIDFNKRGILPPNNYSFNNDESKKSFKENIIELTKRNYYLYDFFWYCRKAYRKVKKRISGN